MNLRQLVERGDRPFAAQPQVGRYFPAASMEDARRRLGRAIDRGEGPGVAIGGAGSGKSLLLQVLAAQYRERFDIVLLACAQLCTRRALLQAIHFELGLDYRRRDEGQLRLSLLDQLLTASDGVEGLLLLVDEAQTLPPHLLEELRVLTNFARGGLPHVRLVLAGLPSLEEKLASPELESFSQRLATRCYLAPFSRDETSQYIRAQLSASGGDPQQVFAAAAIDAVFAATDGVPRLVNQLCDRALLLADAKHASQVDAAAVQDAWADLQQLPAPWETRTDTATNSSTTESVVEFGSLAEAEPIESLETEAIPTALDARPAVADEPTMTINVSRLAQRISSMPFLNDDADDDISSDATELDDEVLTRNSSRHPAPPRPQASRPKSHAEHVPDAVDPFAVPFEEEELVLDSFAALSGLFGTRTPRVENRRDPSFSRFVERVLDTTKPNAPKSLAAREAPRPEPRPNPGEDRPRIRLAVVSDSPPSTHEERHVEKLVAEAEELDFGPPRDSKKSYRQIFSRAVQRAERTEPIAAPAPVAPRAIDAAELSHAAESAILVLEDEAAATEPPDSGVRRESYRDLFSRLRHGA